MDVALQALDDAGRAVVGYCERVQMGIEKMNMRKLQRLMRAMFRAASDVLGEDLARDYFLALAEKLRTDGHLD